MGWGNARDNSKPPIDTRVLMKKTLAKHMGAARMARFTSGGEGSKQSKDGATIFLKFVDEKKQTEHTVQCRKGQTYAEVKRKACAAFKYKDISMTDLETRCVKPCVAIAHVSA